MRILYHHRTLAEDAQGVHIEEMIRALRARGHTVREASLVRRGVEADAKRPGRQASPWRAVARLARGPTYELLELAYNGPAFVRLSRDLRDFAPHLVYERYALATFAGEAAARAHGVPLFLEVNAPLVDEKRNWSKLWFPGLARRVEGRIFRSAARVIAVSDVLARRIAKEGVPSERIRVLRNGVDPARFHARISGARVRERYGLAGGAVLGFVGWFREWHGLERVVEIVASEAMRGAGVRLLLVGDGPARSRIEEIARRHGVADRVLVTGPVVREELPEHIAAFDIALQPAATEYACPMKIPEYLALGKPIIAPDQENIRELLTCGEEALLVPPGDDGSLAEAIRRLVGDEGLRARLGQGGVRRVEREGLFWSRNAERVEAMVREIAEGGE